MTLEEQAENICKLMQALWRLANSENGKQDWKRKRDNEQESNTEMRQLRNSIPKI